MVQDRKARLAALAARAGRRSSAAAAAFPSSSSEEYSSLPEPDPKRARIEDRDDVDKDAVDDEDAHDTGVGKQENVLEQALAQAEAEIPDMTDVSNAMDPSILGSMAPKINSDLKRDIQPQLDKLERRTQRAIVELLKERLQQEASALEEETR